MVQVVQSGNPSIAVAQNPLAGNPGNCREVTLAWTGNIVRAHLLNGATLNPGTIPAAAVITVSLDYHSVAGSDCGDPAFPGTLFGCVRQGSNFYFARIVGPITPGLGWVSGSVSLSSFRPIASLSAGTCSLALAAVGGPVLAAGAPPLEFGFADWKCCSGSSTRTDRIDNFAVSISLGSIELSRAGVPPNPTALLPGQTSGPVVGGTWDPRVDHTTFLPNATTDVLLFGMGQINAPSPYGTLLCGSPVVLAQVAAGSPFRVPVPAACSLVGLAGCVQVASLAAPGTLLVTNAIDFVIGT